MKNQMPLDSVSMLSKEDLLNLFGKDFFTIEPYWHQLVALGHAAFEDKIALFFEMGLGKTKTVIDWLRLKGVKDKILVVTVNEPLCYNWQDEINKNSNYSSVILLGSRKNRIENLKKDYDIYIINYDGYIVRENKSINNLIAGGKYQNQSQLDFYNLMYDKGWNAIILDESRRIKNLKSQRTKRIILLGKNVKYKAILTGIPTVNPLDIFPQFLFLDDGKVYGKNFFKFRRKFFEEVGWQWTKWQLRDDAKEEFIDLMHSNSIRFTKDQCLNLPEKQYQTINITMSKKQFDDYTKLANDDGDLSLANLPYDMLQNKIMKYAQITGGFLKYEETITSYPKNPKMDALEDLISDSVNDTKIVIFHRFIHEGRMIEDKLKKMKIKYVSMRGETKNKKDSYKRFVNDDSVRVIVAHPKSGGIGLNFYMSHVCIFYSLDFDIEARKQCEDRLHRIGQENIVNYYFLVCPKTIDAKVLSAHEEGLSLMDVVNNRNFSKAIKGE